MIRRLSIISGLVVLSAFALTGKANAQSVDVNFSGIVPNTCTITKVSNGTLSLVNPNLLDANANRGQVLVNCAGSGAVTISNPVATSTVAANYAGLSGTQTVAELWSSATGGTYLADSQGMFGNTSYTAASNNQNVPLYVNVFSRNSAIPLPTGTYAFKTTVTVNPL